MLFKNKFLIAIFLDFVLKILHGEKIKEEPQTMNSYKESYYLNW